MELETNPIGGIATTERKILGHDLEIMNQSVAVNVIKSELTARVFQILCVSIQGELRYAAMQL